MWVRAGAQPVAAPGRRRWCPQGPVALAAGLGDPDDRKNPRLEFFHESDLLGVQPTPAASLGLGPLVWLRGAQNVVIDGLFGYTDPDGSAVGRTPELIRLVEPGSRRQRGRGATTNPFAGACLIRRARALGPSEAGPDHPARALTASRRSVAERQGARTR